MQTSRSASFQSAESNPSAAVTRAGSLDDSAWGHPLHDPHPQQGAEVAEQSCLPRYPSGALIFTVDDVIELETALRAKHSAGAIPEAIEESTEPLLGESGTTAAETRPKFVWKGAKRWPLAIVVLVGCSICFSPIKPAGIDPKGWTLLGIFVATILALVLEPLPTGAVAIISATAAVMSGSLTVGQTFSAFSSSTIWMIVASFFFARGFQQTGLGDRVANIFVRFIGHSTLGLSYGLTVAHLLLCPTMPSTSARATGIFMPIVVSLSKASGILRLLVSLPSYPA
mmetsp:Transcript_16387/g.45651  ORF Transcript_16387/g.45651 Transcript_16387/m.45651 type:complete len:284 (-) Transcript_16387:9-860(-)